jgi:hypothetical protein
VVEHHDGRIEVVKWGVHGAVAVAPLPALPARSAPALPRPSVEAGERIYLMPDI